MGKLHKIYEVNYIEIIKKKLNGNALLCGIGDWNESVGKSDVADYRFLASIWATKNLTDIVISEKI